MRSSAFLYILFKLLTYKNFKCHDPLKNQQICIKVGMDDLESFRENINTHFLKSNLQHLKERGLKILAWLGEDHRITVHKLGGVQHQSSSHYFFLQRPSHPLSVSSRWRFLVCQAASPNSSLPLWERKMAVVLAPLSAAHHSEPEGPHGSHTAPLGSPLGRGSSLPGESWGACWSVRAREEWLGGLHVSHGSSDHALDTTLWIFYLKDFGG